MQNGRDMIPNRPVQTIPHRTAQSIARNVEETVEKVERVVKEKTANAKDKAIEKMDAAESRVGKYVHARPFESIGMAFLGGFVARRLLWPAHKNR